MSIDFERAKLLMDIVVSAGQHGPLYQKLASAAGDELKTLVDQADAELKEKAQAEAERRATDEAKAAEENQRRLDLEEAPKGHLEQQMEDNNKRVTPVVRPAVSDQVRRPI